MTKTRDPGLQPERTALAWNRTALAIAVNAALLLRSGVVRGNAFITVAALAMGLLAAGVTIYSTYRRRHFSDRAEGRTERLAAGSPAPHAAISLVVVGAAIVALLSIFVA